MNKTKVEAVLSGILDMLNTEGGASKEVLAAFVNELYEGVVGKYRPVIHAIPLVATKAAGDITPIAVAVLKLVNTVSADQTLQEEMAVGNKLKAERRFKTLNASQSAGFTRAEAMSLLLADIAGFKETRKQFTSSTKKTCS
ncbi:MAG: hypothetical protein A2845_01825 [Candidatus Lloydbacteria bacterium RIFCSPHIGHO2_01_FULL_49_22]|uniref:Uncharacterized protein n=1 Tax=Candidatus Lloydbacteria bacterium RIFCSPHIGHO2_01_FULL_49_22 TaxID=1798658 RepID=A0A1G2CXR0_9BACT|nr:MAG: hypothetical protein A2845_01825 [Candidatus Lloydbacteria bacterium RIFCSPHIGHO2_01_FULL_49_22]OGZ10035.1 MAG: hypothetical protein A3C14_04990 [Candidatus Lloydbacteria bacterium RIFCSPHIGHO2_02_FULL_50_18]